MITFHEVVEYCKAEALAGVFYRTDSSDWRWFCRQYSEMFGVPPFQVEQLPPEHVILYVFEKQLEQYDLEKHEDLQALIEQVHRIEDPNYDENQEQEIQDFIAAAEAYELVRKKKGKKMPDLNARIAKIEQKKLAEPPKQGMINLSYLEEHDSKE